MDEIVGAPLPEPAENVSPTTVAAGAVPAVTGWPGSAVPAVAGRSGGRRRARALWAGVFGVLLGLVAAMTCAAAFLGGLAIAYEGRVLPGVSVGGVSLSGLDRPAALARLQAALPAPDAGRLVLRVEGETYGVPLQTLSRRYRVDEAVDAALAYGRQGSLLERGSAEARGLLAGVEVGTAVVYDGSAMTSFLMETAFEAAVTPLDAELRWVPRTPWFVVAPHRVGRYLDLAATRGALDAALRGPVGGDVVVDATVVPASPAVTQAMADQTMTSALRMTASGLTLRSGSRSWAISRATVASWLVFGLDEHGTYAVRAAPERIAASLAAIGKQVARPAKDAVFVTKGGKVVGVIASSKGARLDMEVTSARIAVAIAGLAQGDRPAPVDLAVTAVPPAIDSAQAASYLPRMVLLGSWTVPYQPSEKNFFGRNIQIPTNMINGYVVLPGSWFDFWKVVTISRALGFGPGGFIRNGHTDPTGALGGGICSVSTTLFNAALRSGLQMGARDNHYYYITRYPVGLDATVWKESASSVQTMSFRNDMRYPILIRGINGRGKVTFQVYGVPDGRRVVLSKPIIQDFVKATDEVQYTSSLPRGTTKRVEWPADGFRAWVTRTVYAADGSILHRETYYSNYSRVNGLVLIGTG